MSVNGKARAAPTLAQRIIEMQQQIEALKSRLRERGGFPSVESKPIGTAGGTSAAPGSGGFLKTEGDTMIGPIAYFPKLQAIDTTDNSLNLARELNEAFSSRVIVSTTGGGTQIDTIHGAAHAGQILMIQGILTETFTIKHGLGNIRTFDSGDLEVVDNQNVWLVFDAIANEWAAVGGGGVSGTGTNISCDLVADQTANLAVGNHIEFDRNAPPTGHDGGIVLQTGAGQADGIFELKAGKTYFLSGVVSPIKSAATQLLVAWYDRTNAQELGRRTVYDVNNVINLDNQPKAEIIFTPSTDVEVDLRIVANSTPANLTGFFAITTHAHIFEFSGRNGSDGAPGADGSSLNWKDSVRAKTVVDVPNLATFNVVTDGVTLVEGDRVLLTEQDTASENGIYTVGAVTTGVAALTRSTDFDSNAEVVASVFVAVEEGSNSNANTLWQLITNNTIIVGTTAQVWQKYAPGGSGGPNLGGGSDGVDADGQFVNDGRIAQAEHLLQRWELVSPAGATPDYSFADLLWIPPLGNTKGRLLLSGRDETPTTVSFAYSDDLGTNWTAAGAGNQDSITPFSMCYDPTGRTPDDTSAGIGMALMNGTSVNNMLRRTTDRGATWSIINSLNTDLYTDLEWTPDESQFIAVSHSVPVATGNTRAIKTSPDGSTWTLRTTPAPTINTLGFWTKLAYSTALGRYIAIANGGDDLMYSDNAGVSWTLADPGSEVGATGPTDLIYSKGQDKFVMLAIEPIDDIMYVFHSVDGLTWTRYEVDRKRTAEGETGMSGLSIRYFPDLSLYIISGWRGNTSDNSSQVFWFSHDAITWTNLHRMPEFINFGWANVVEYLKEYGIFVGVGGLVGTRTMWRTTR